MPVTMFLMWEDKLRYGKFVEDLANDFTKNMKNYPDTLVQAYNYLVKICGCAVSSRTEFYRQ